MKRSDISDAQVCEAYAYADFMYKTTGAPLWPSDVLIGRFHCPEKVAFAAMERAYDRGLIEYGVSLRAGWLTEKGKALAREL